MSKKKAVVTNCATCTLYRISAVALCGSINNASQVIQIHLFHREKTSCIRGKKCEKFSSNLSQAHLAVIYWKSMSFVKFVQYWHRRQMKIWLCMHNASLWQQESTEWYCKLATWMLACLRCKKNPTTHIHRKCFRHLRMSKHNIFLLHEKKPKWGKRQPKCIQNLKREVSKRKKHHKIVES